MGELLSFPTITREPLEPISELIAAKPELWAKLLGSKVIEENVNIVLGSD